MWTKRAYWLGLALALSLPFSGCVAEQDRIDGTFTPDEWEKIATLSPLPETPPTSKTNKYADDPRAAALGQQFFHEKDFSGPLLVGSDGGNGGCGKVGEPSRVACATCHEGEWFIDMHSRPNNASLGTDWLPRNANSAVNAAFYSPWIRNDGYADSVWSATLLDPELPIAMNGSRLRVVRVIFDKYRAEYNEVFEPKLGGSVATLPPDGKPGMATFDSLSPEQQRMVNTIFANFGKALEAYLRRLVSGGSTFDRYVAGDFGAISPSAKDGLKLFIGKANCVECHKGSHFSDDEFHVIGLAPEGEHINVEETGREAALETLLQNPFNSMGEWSDAKEAGYLDDLPPIKEERGKWRTKGLRNVAKTGPWMHTGQFDKLEDVVKFYDGGGHDSGFMGEQDKAIQELHLTDAEIEDIVAFLETLTGEPVPAALRADTSKRDGGWNSDDDDDH